MRRAPSTDTRGTRDDTLKLYVVCLSVCTLVCVSGVSILVMCERTHTHTTCACFDEFVFDKKNPLSCTVRLRGFAALALTHITQKGIRYADMQRRESAIVIRTSQAHNDRVTADRLSARHVGHAACTSTRHLIHRRPVSVSVEPPNLFPVRRQRPTLVIFIISQIVEPPFTGRRLLWSDVRPLSLSTLPNLMGRTSFNMPSPDGTCTAMLRATHLSDGIATGAAPRLLCSLGDCAWRASRAASI